jgi:membrane protein YqaA with SNARE-associated domain
MSNWQLAFWLIVCAAIGNVIGALIADPLGKYLGIIP